MTNDATYGSYLLAEDEFVVAVEECRYANAEFRHADHIRLAWIYVRRYGARQAEERIARLSAGSPSATVTKGNITER